MLTIWSAGICRLAQADQSQVGRQIYVQKCATCHGANGEGVSDKSEMPLYGDKSLDELVDLAVVKQIRHEGEEGRRANGAMSTDGA